jgi:hypothetical protein
MTLVVVAGWVSMVFGTRLLPPPTVLHRRCVACVCGLQVVMFPEDSKGPCRADNTQHRNLSKVQSTRRQAASELPVEIAVSIAAQSCSVW